MKALLEAARRRQVDAVAVVKLDRLGRSLSHLLGVLGKLESLNVAFVSLDDGVDTQTAAGRLFMQIRGAFAEYEAALIRERTLAGLEAARPARQEARPTAGDGCCPGCASAAHEGCRSQRPVYRGRAGDIAGHGSPCGQGCRVVRVIGRSTGA